ncbi:protein MOR1 [Tanacetum coccineum]
MANLSFADPVYDEAGLSYDSDILSEVHDHDHYQDAICEYHEEHEMHDDVQLKLRLPVVQSNVSSVPNDAYMMIFNDMHELHANLSLTTTRKHSGVITRAKHIEQTTALLTENENLKAQIHENLKCDTMESVKPRVLALSRLVPSCFVIFDLEPLLLSFDFNEARKANQTAMVAEKKRMEAPQESRGISKQKWMVERKKKIGKLLDSNGMDMSKAYMLDTQQMAEAKYKKWEKEPAPGGWDAITSLKEQVIALEELGFPGWSEKNVQVQQQVIEVVSHIASTRTKFPMKCVVLCIAGIWERVADIKTCAQAMKCLTTFSEVMGKGFIFEIMSEIMKEHKNPKVLSEGLLWMVFAVDDFGVAAATRNATIKFVGPDIKAFLSDVEAECEKNPFEGAAAATKKTVKASDSVSSVFGGGLDSLPREDNSGKITPELLKLLECSDWKMRSESIEAVLMFSFAPEAEGFFGDIGPQMVLKNVRDIHGLTLAIVLERLNSHGAFPEIHDKTRATRTGPTVKTTSKIGKSNRYGSKSESKAVSSVRYGSYTLFFPICEINIQFVTILYFKRGVSAKRSKAVFIMSLHDISGPVGSRIAFTRIEPQRERHPMAQPSVIGPTDCNEATLTDQQVCGRYESGTTKVPSTSTEVPSGNGMEIDNSDLTFGIHPFYVEKCDNSVEAKGFDFLAPTTRRNFMHVLRAMQFYWEEVQVLERRLVLALGKFSGHFGLRINLSKQVIAESL